MSGAADSMSLLNVWKRKPIKCWTKPMLWLQLNQSAEESDISDLMSKV